MKEKQFYYVLFCYFSRLKAVCQFGHQTGLTTSNTFFIVVYEMLRMLKLFSLKAHYYKSSTSYSNAKRILV